MVTNIVDVNLVKNGNFEARDLSGTPGTFTGWETAQVPNSRGGWYLQSGTLSPLSQTPVPAPPTSGSGASVYQAMADQSNLIPIGGDNGEGDPTIGPGNPNPNAASTYSGSNFLYQDITLPGSATTLTFSMDLYLNSAAAFTSGESSLDFSSTQNNPDQQVRVDFIDPNAPITATNASTYNPSSKAGTPGVLLSIFQTASTTARVQSLVITLTPAQQQELNALITPGTNRTIRLRISEVNTQGRLTVGVDNVMLTAQYTDTTPPAPQRPNAAKPWLPDRLQWYNHPRHHRSDAYRLGERRRRRFQH